MQSPPPLTMALVAAAAILLILLLHELLWLAFSLLYTWARRLPADLWGLRDWAADHPFHARIATRYPRLYAFARARLSRKSFTGLPLTLMVAAGAYLLALLGGLIEDLLENEGVVAFDESINAFFDPFRVRPFLEIFLWITALGAGPAITAVALIATGFLWADRRAAVIVPLWITLLGAQVTTWAGKYIIGRPRPKFLDIVSAASQSFPSGHATASMAVYGFVAYAIARNLPRARPRFEVAFWTGILIVLIGFSRMFLSLHYTSDVLSGFIVGGFWLLVGFAAAEWRRDPP